MYFVLLVFHSFSLFLFGQAVLKRWFGQYPALLSVVAAFLLGVLVGVPLTYGVAWVLRGTADPVGGSALVTSLILLGITRLLAGKGKKSTKEKRSISVGEVGVVLFSLACSSWLMSKTFHGDSAGQVFVGSNNIFDFGMAIGLMRFMAWGDGIPFASPFFSGTPMLYHFFFLFWSAMWHHLGIPMVWALNIPSIFSFSALLIAIYYFPQVILAQKPWVGWLAIIFTLTNSSLAFWHLLAKYGASLGFLRDLWRLPTYPFAGPFDGSTISIFVTLNSYVNQRHLAFSIAVGLFLYMVAAVWVSKQKSPFHVVIVLGVGTGLLVGWNMVIYLLVAGAIAGLFVVHTQWKALFAYTMIAMAVGLLFFVPIVSYLYTSVLFVNKLLAAHGGQQAPTWNVIDYLWQNLGILPLVAGAGFLILPKKMRLLFFPLVLGFLALCMLPIVGSRGFEQKTYSFFIIGMNILAAVAVGWFWRGKKWLTKITVALIVVILTVSGIMNLFPIKNEFAFPLIDHTSLPLIQWIHTETPRGAVFVSYADMIDPVVLAGRKNYFGFFGNIGRRDRADVVNQVYSGNIEVAKSHGISYVLVPKWQKNDFPYAVDLKILEATYKKVYEDERYLVFALP